MIHIKSVSIVLHWNWVCPWQTIIFIKSIFSVSGFFKTTGSVCQKKQTKKKLSYNDPAIFEPCTQDLSFSRRKEKERSWKRGWQHPCWRASQVSLIMWHRYWRPSAEMYTVCLWNFPEHPIFGKVWYIVLKRNINMFWRGIESGPIQFKRARKIWPCSNCSQKLESARLLVLAKFLPLLACSDFR